MDMPCYSTGNRWLTYSPQSFITFPLANQAYFALPAATSGIHSMFSVGPSNLFINFVSDLSKLCFGSTRLIYRGRCVACAVFSSLQQNQAYI